jgi:tRNA dimethylallyltransferase
MSSDPGPFTFTDSLKTNICHPIVVVCGPTATGKSDLAQEIALALGGEAVSADSMQIYRGMDIGTAKLMPKDRKVPHHLIDICDPGEAYSAARFQQDSREAFKDIRDRGGVPVLVGGTGFYVRAAIDAYDFPPGEQIENPTRDKYNAYLEQNGADALWAMLQDVDPQSAALIHPNNSKRVVRAFELLAEGKTYAEQLNNLHNIEPAYDSIFIGLDAERDYLRNRIDIRVDNMREAGLVQEVENLLNAGFKEAITAPQAIGYKEIVAALDGQCSLDEAFEQIKTASKRYAKRQRSWFRQDKRVHWLDTTTINSATRNQLLKDTLEIISAHDNIK